MSTYCSREHREGPPEQSLFARVLCSGNSSLDKSGSRRMARDGRLDAYRSNEKCLQLAQAFNDQERRLATLSMAAAWLSLAEQHLKNCEIAETVLVFETSTPVDERRKPRR